MLCFVLCILDGALIKKHEKKTRWMVTAWFRMRNYSDCAHNDKSANANVFLWLCSTVYRSQIVSTHNLDFRVDFCYKIEEKKLALVTWILDSSFICCCCVWATLILVFVHRTFFANKWGMSMVCTKKKKKHTHFDENAIRVDLPIVVACMCFFIRSIAKFVACKQSFMKKNRFLLLIWMIRIQSVQQKQIRSMKGRFGTIFELCTKSIFILCQLCESLDEAAK